MGVQKETDKIEAVTKKHKTTIACMQHGAKLTTNGSSNSGTAKLTSAQMGRFLEVGTTTLGGKTDVSVHLRAECATLDHMPQRCLQLLQCHSAVCDFTRDVNESITESRSNGDEFSKQLLLIKSESCEIVLASNEWVDKHKS